MTIYQTGQVQAQNLWSTLKSIITSPDTSLATPISYWTYIGSSDTDGVFQSTDGNGTLIRMMDCGIGLGLGLGVYKSYTPNATQGQNGTFGTGDFGIIYYYNGNISGSSSNFPGPTKTQNGQTGPYWSSTVSSSTANNNGTSTYNCGAPTMLVNYWVFVNANTVAIVLQGDPALPQSIMQFGMAGRIIPWSNETSNACSFYMCTQWKGWPGVSGSYYPVPGGNSSYLNGVLYMLSNRGGANNAQYNWDYPVIINTQPNVWDGNYYFSPVNVYRTDEGVRGSIDGFAIVSTTNLANGDEITYTDAQGIQHVWKHFVCQVATNFTNSSYTVAPSTSILLRETA